MALPNSQSWSCHSYSKSVFVTLYLMLYIERTIDPLISFLGLKNITWFYESILKIAKKRKCEISFRKEEKFLITRSKNEGKNRKNDDLAACMCTCILGEKCGS